MTRSRAVVFVAVIVIVLGVGVGLSALYLGPARAAVGPLPAEALVLPADARFVVGFDVKRFVNSPMYVRFTGPNRASVFHDIEEATGLNPERDVEQIVVAGRGGTGARPPIAVVLGAFDRQKLGRAIETEKKNRVTWKSVEGTTVYLFDEGSPKAMALAFLDDRALVMGDADSVHGAVTTRAGQSPGFRANTTLGPLLERLKPGSAFWMVGDQSLLSNLPKSVPGGGDTQMTLPGLQSLSVTGELDPLLAVSITGEAADPAGANSLADVVRGLVALANLQAGQKPELKELVSAITVATDQNRVLVNARIPYALLDALQPPRRTGAAPGAPSSALK